MGCLHSTLNNDEVVSRFYSRKRFMKQAVTYRHVFAASHSAYLQALRNAGAALHQFAEGEMREPPSSPFTVACSQHETLPEPPPPPPPLPTAPIPAFNDASFDSHHVHCDGTPTPLCSRPMSPLPTKEEYWDPEPSISDNPPPPPPSPPNSTWTFLDPFRPSSPPVHLEEQRKTQRTHEEEDLKQNKLCEDVPDLEEDSVGKGIPNPLKGTLVKWERDNTELALVARLRGRKNLLEIVNELDDELLKASAGGGDASKVLETRRAHFHTNFPIQSRRRNHRSARVFSAFNWSWSKLSKDDIERNLQESEAIGSHALTLERLLAWEKKLYGEVKSGESLRSEHERKCYVLRSQEARGLDSNTVDKTRAQVKKLHSLILVSFQGVESTTAAIQSLRDDELYPQLVELVEAVTSMWKTMYACHARQKQIALQIRNLDSVFIQAKEPTSEFHHEATIQLERALGNWYDCFCNLVNSHREYISALNGWLRLSLIQAEDNAYEKVKQTEDMESPKNTSVPKIFGLCEEWQRALDRLPDKVPSEAIKSLVTVVHAMVRQQADELRQRQKTEILLKQLEKKTRNLRNWESKYVESLPHPLAPSTQRYIEAEDGESDEGSGADTESNIVTTPVVKDPLAEKKAAVDSFKKKVESEKVKHSKSIQDTRILTMNNLQTGLPGVFEAMTGFSAVSAQAFEGLCNYVRMGKLQDHPKDSCVPYDD